MDPTGEKQNATPRILGWRGRTGGWELPGMSVVVEAEGLSAARAPRGVYSLVAPPTDPEGKTSPLGPEVLRIPGGAGPGGRDVPGQSSWKANKLRSSGKRSKKEAKSGGVFTM